MTVVTTLDITDLTGIEYPTPRETTFAGVSAVADRHPTRRGYHVGTTSSWVPLWVPNESR